MPKSHTIKLGNQDRELKYRRKDREYLEERFKDGLFDIMRKRVFPTDEDGKPTGGGELGPQTALVWAGLRWAGPKMRENQVAEWLDALVEEGRSPFEVYAECISAVVDSGVLGYRPTDEPEDESEEGKGSPGSEPPGES